MQFKSSSTEHILKYFLPRYYSLPQSFKISRMKYFSNFMNFGQFHEMFYPLNKIDLFVWKIKEPQFFFSSTNITYLECS